MQVYSIIQHCSDDNACVSWYVLRPIFLQKMVDLVWHLMKANGDETSLTIKAASAAYVIHSRRYHAPEYLNAILRCIMTIT